MSSAPSFTLLSREGCELCEEMFAELRAFCSGKALEFHCVDVDADSELRTRFGHKVPVLLLDGMPVCHGQFDVEEVQRLLRQR
ncbi:MAG TPA: glutaredoxin family protein [Steroidobacteraceae bacterium]|nr:glutaredoxin family protein [Steroidobacteraceae bacterium]